MAMLRRVGLHKIKGGAIGRLHVKFHEIRNRKPLPQNQPVLHNMQEPHPGTAAPGARLAGRSMSQILQKSEGNEYCPSNHCWREWMVIVSPVALLCLSAFKEYAQKCMRTSAFKSFFCRRWFKPIKAQPNKNSLPSTSLRYSRSPTGNFKSFLISTLHNYLLGKRQIQCKA